MSSNETLMNVDIDNIFNMKTLEMILKPKVLGYTGKAWN